jgi:hypothetical protein
MILNDSLKFTVGNVMRMLKVDRNAITLWAYKFSEYLSAKANPGKGIKREFDLTDIRVMAYIYTLWENNPDIEHIKIGLNNNDQFENPDIANLLTSLTPLFIEPPENMDESWKHGVIISGLASLEDMLMFARSYKLAGDRLIEISLENEEAVDLMYPALFNYRHSIELYLKVITGKYKQTHDLLYLFTKLKELLKSEFNSNVPEWFENIVLKFNSYDPGGTTFRYGGGHENDEVFINFIQLKKIMGWLADSFQKILQRKGITY